jgi:hypothetical protein
MVRAGHVPAGTERQDMTGNGTTVTEKSTSTTGDGSSPGQTPGGRKQTGAENPGWTVFSYMLAGMIFYGGVGWAIGHWVIHSPLWFPLGMVVGLALSIVLVILRFGRS